MGLPDPLLPHTVPQSPLCPHSLYWKVVPGKVRSFLMSHNSKIILTGFTPLPSALLTSRVYNQRLIQLDPQTSSHTLSHQPCAQHPPTLARLWQLQQGSDAGTEPKGAEALPHRKGALRTPW